MMLDRLSRLLMARRFRLATAESCTGGMIAARLTDWPGSSAWFDRAYITYSNQAKAEMLGVPLALFEAHGAVSESVVRAMVDGVLQRAPVNAVLSVSGIAGPGGGSKDKPVGTVWFAWGLRAGSNDGARVDAVCRRFYGNRDMVRQQALECALAGMLRLLEADD